MPPKVRTDRDAIVRAAFEVAKSEGVAAITAQSVSSVLKISVAPIFRVFQTVEELRTVTIKEINEFHRQYIKDYSIENSEFLTYGIAYIQFAKEYPLLFETIMLPSPIDIGERMSGEFSFVVDSVSNHSGLDFESAENLFLNMWIYAHGIACLVYKGSLKMPQEEEKKLLESAFTAFLKNNGTSSTSI